MHATTMQVYSDKLNVKKMLASGTYTVEPLYNRHHWNQHFVPYSKVFHFKGFQCISGRCATVQLGVLRALLCCMLAGKAKQRLALRVKVLI